MTLLGLILTLVLVGVLLWLINSFIPMEPTVKKILNAAVAIVLVLWIISEIFGGFGGLNQTIRIR